jgi:hypothetical protein
MTYQHQRLPGGQISYRRTPKRVWIDIDRYPYFDLEQSRWIGAIEMHARLRIRGSLVTKPRGWFITCGWHQSTWGSYFDALRGDEADVLAALSGIEDRDYLPVRRYLATPRLSQLHKCEEKYHYPTSLDDSWTPTLVGEQ